MLVSIAIAALSALGAKANYGNALKIASSMPTGGLPALAVAGGGQLGGAGTATGVLIGPGTGSLGVAGNAMMQADDKGGGGSDKSDTKASTDGPAKLDASMSSARPSEQATAERVAAMSKFKGRTFRAPPPPDPGFDWIDDLGQTFDALGDGTKSKYFRLEQFKASIDHHLLKGNTFTVIDMTGYTAEQIAAVRAYVDTLPADQIIRVGF